MLVLCGWTVLLEAKKSIAESKAEHNDESASKGRISFTPVLCKWYNWSSSKASKSWTSPTVLARCLQAPRLSVQWHRHTWKLAERKSPPDDHVVFRRCRQRTGKLVKFSVGVNYERCIQDTDCSGFIRGRFANRCCRVVSQIQRKEKKNEERKHFRVDSLWKFVIEHLFCFHSKRLLSTICMSECTSLDLQALVSLLTPPANSSLDILTRNWDVITFQIPFFSDHVAQFVSWARLRVEFVSPLFFVVVFPVRYWFALHIVLYGSMQVLEMERKGEIGAKGALGRNNATPVIRWHHRKPKRNIRKNCLKAKVHATRK